jgi:hypothetical protein
MMGYTVRIPETQSFNELISEHQQEATRCQCVNEGKLLRNRTFFVVIDTIGGLPVIARISMGTMDIFKGALALVLQSTLQAPVC